MVKAADTNNDGTIDEEEFIMVMKSQGKGRLSGKNVMGKMKNELKRYIQHQKLLDGYKNMKPHIKWIFDEVSAINEGFMLRAQQMGK